MLDLAGYLLGFAAALFAMDRLTSFADLRVGGRE